MSVGGVGLPLPSRRAMRWHERRSFGDAQMPPLAALGLRKRATGIRVSVGIPALNEEATIGRICGVIQRELMEETPLVDELVVLDGESVDETALHAEAEGARVLNVSTVMSEVPLKRGKGESLWRSLAVLSGDVVVWVDADIRNFQSHFVTRLIAPILMDPSIDFVKGHYERPIETGGDLSSTGGGRVTELQARPLLNLLFPELGGFLQPLAGEYAGRAEVLRQIPFFSGYSVEVGLLIDLLDLVGLDRMAQVDLGRRVHRNRPLEELAPMAYAIAKTILRRAEERGRIKAFLDFPFHPLLAPGRDGLRPMLIDEVERPPITLALPHLAALRSSEYGIRPAPTSRR